jgi:hypothetical protein
MWTAHEFDSRGVVARPFSPRIDFEFAAVFPPQRSPSPVALDLVEVMRRALDELNGLPIFNADGDGASLPPERRALTD